MDRPDGIDISQDIQSSAIYIELTVGFQELWLKLVTKNVSSAEGTENLRCTATRCNELISSPLYPTCA